MRVVFDTNVLISALLLPSSTPREALEFARNNGKLLISFPLLNELSEVLGRKQFRRYVDEEDIRTFIAALSRDSEWVEVGVHIVASRDPKDDKGLELALAGKATHIVTGDGDLLELNPFRGILVLTPQEFLLRLSQAQ